MGTCPKCKLRIRRNGNHIKLGTVWLHKSCPARLAVVKVAAAAQPVAEAQPAAAPKRVARRAPAETKRAVKPAAKPARAKRA
ncbi:MAG TPA: hypothetical protein VL948_19925 [Verrucomicrobiae bacterium]|jgi:hypothetical protein|nr:hypothetical protein [Verrucomicrobiae bacterium]